VGRWIEKVEYVGDKECVCIQVAASDGLYLTNDFIPTHNTTLARWTSRRFGFPMISEVARQVLAEMEVSLLSLRTDLGLVAEYQRKVFERQVLAEQQAGPAFVSDRAFDNLAYASEHTLVVADLLEDPCFLTYVKGVASGLVFFVRPQKDLLREDGTRESPTWEGVVRIDAMVKFMLEQFRVPYLSLDSASMQERVRAVEFVCCR
jgi:predicted ATPase